MRIRIYSKYLIGAVRGAVFIYLFVINAKKTPWIIKESLAG